MEKKNSACGWENKCSPLNCSLTLNHEAELFSKLEIDTQEFWFYSTWNAYDAHKTKIENTFQMIEKIITQGAGLQLGSKYLHEWKSDTFICCSVKTWSRGGQWSLTWHPTSSTLVFLLCGISCKVVCSRDRPPLPVQLPNVFFEVQCHRVHRPAVALAANITLRYQVSCWKANLQKH